MDGLMSVVSSIADIPREAIASRRARHTSPFSLACPVPIPSFWCGPFLNRFAPSRKTLSDIASPVPDVDQRPERSAQ
jgi:hypothetical protein